MISDITVEAKMRTRTGSADSRRLRRQGLIPATVYGDHKDPLSVIVDDVAAYHAGRQQLVSAAHA